MLLRPLIHSFFSSRSPNSSSGQLLRHNNYSFRLLTSQNSSQAFQFLVKTLAYRNPINKAFYALYSHLKGQAERKQRIYWSHHFPQMIKNGTAVTIYDLNDKDEIVGFGGSLDMAWNYEQNVYQPLNGCQNSMAEQEILRLLFRKMSVQMQQIFGRRGQVMDLNCMAVSAERKGLFTRSLLVQQQMARLRGYRYLYVFLQNVHTKKQFIRSGFKPLAQIDVIQFKFRGRRPYALLEEEHRYNCTMLKQLT